MKLELRSCSILCDAERNLSATAKFFVFYLLEQIHTATTMCSLYYYQRTVIQQYGGQYVAL